MSRYQQSSQAAGQGGSFGNNNTLLLPSMTISVDSKTPYTDATQVSAIELIDFS